MRPSASPVTVIANAFSVAILIGCVALTMSPTQAAAAEPKYPLKEGQPFPRVLLPSMDAGRPMTIDDFAGGESKVVLHLFASW